MTPDKDIMDFVFAEQHPSGGVTLLIDGNRRKEPGHTALGDGCHPRVSDGKDRVCDAERAEPPA
jgi:hypothetical protein